jgi:hypothetical protein
MYFSTKRYFGILPDVSSAYFVVTTTNSSTMWYVLQASFGIVGFLVEATKKIRTGQGFRNDPRKAGNGSLPCFLAAQWSTATQDDIFTRD